MRLAKFIHLNQFLCLTKNPVNDIGTLDALTIPDFTATHTSNVMIEGTRMLAEGTEVPIAAFMT